MTLKKEKGEERRLLREGEIEGTLPQELSIRLLGFQDDLGGWKAHVLGGV